jgi:hypothetical protein
LTTIGEEQPVLTRDNTSGEWIPDRLFLYQYMLI